jgi:hypothetical protein
MSFNDNPNKLESIFIQRDNTNTYFSQVNVSGSDVIFYHSSSGEFTADKISVWAAKYGIGSGGSIIPGSSYDISASFSSASISSSYALSASHAETCDMYVNIDGGTPYSVFGGIPLVIIGGGP